MRLQGASLTLEVVESRQRVLELAGERALRGRVRDISLGGAKLLAEQALPAGARLLMEIELAPGEAIYASASVIRRAPRSHSAPTQEEKKPTLALRFTQVARVDQLQIQRFLLQRSRAEGKNLPSAA